ncbi:hypothetical protein TCAL_09103 [Tigriopus californicus]|uniref:RING-type E3 ubiquitin transferase n=1 Tax=Tigriopus californicus TaxID=6832 RepID=A0A553N882_TIGCA|nr:hypothetical protein TCAL_09103 [Tigriopus californicus]|eukprot:TCALIF_09103-PA protein Name:"Similar to RAD18 Postreplication repair E3 ubiquitin-protein ligase RAD18 (Yarrowia lipolytica (strain CLIB 122 / E 150))" AED:0.20 eAED:0.20 QI:0/0/0/1/1/1/2/0/569
MTALAGCPEAWTAHGPDWAQLAERLRCRICYDLYQAPVITGCGHHFCAQCIRNYLNYKPQCPLCYQDTFEADLRPNRDFQAILELLLERILPQMAAQTRISAPSAPLPPGPAPPGSAPTSAQTAPAASDERGACPVCGVAIPRRNLNRHVDGCLASVPRVTAIGLEERSEPVSPAPVLKPVQKVVYHLLKDAELRKRLKEHGLDTKGTRTKPVSKLQIVMQVDREEKLLKQARSGTIRPPQLNYSRNTDQKEIESKSKDYLQAHRGQFSDLIAQARQNQRRTRVQNPAAPTAPNPEPVIHENTDTSDSNEVCILAETPTKSLNSSRNSSMIDSLDQGILEKPSRASRKESIFFQPTGSKARGNLSHNSSLVDSMDQVTLDKPAHKASKESGRAQPTGSVGSTIYVTPKRKNARDLMQDLSPKRLKQKNIESSLKKGTPKSGSNKSKCPVCEQDVPNVHMNAHLDRCLRTTAFTPSEDEFMDSMIEDSDSEKSNLDLRNLAMRTQNSRRAKSRAILNVTQVPSSDEEDANDFVADEKENATVRSQPFVGKGKGIGKRSTRVRGSRTQKAV